MNMTMSKPFDVLFSRVEVITSIQRRRRWSTAEKLRLVQEAMQPGMSVSFVARQAGISPSQHRRLRTCTGRVPSSEVQSEVGWAAAPRISHPRALNGSFDQTA